MRIITFLLALFVVMSTSGHVYAASDRCPRHQVRTDLKAKLAKTRTFQASSDEFSDYLLGPHRGGDKVFGFVNQSEIYTELAYRFEVTEAGENRYCVNLEEVRGYFYAAPQLFLPTDYKKSSCEYKEIYKHEKRHLRAVYDFHKKNKKKYAAQLGKIARTVPIFPPVTTQGEVESIKQSIIDYYENEFRAFEINSLIELDAAQRKIDSPSEYNGVRKRCNNW